MFDKMKNKFNSVFNDGPDLSRRKFIKDAASLAALTVVASHIPSIAKYNEIRDQIAAGIVENQTFYLTETVVIDIPNVVIRNCNFIAVEPMNYMFELGQNAHDCLVSSCSFDTRGMVDTVVRLEPQGDIDMTKTFQSAINIAANCGDRSLKLQPGTHSISSAIKWKS